MKNKIVSELMAICDMESDDSRVGWRKRRDAMEEWIADNIIESDTELSVINPSVFSTDAMDFIKESLAKKASEELTTNIKYDITNNRIRARMLVLKVKR